MAKKVKYKPKKIKLCASDLVLQIVTTILLSIVLLITLYPIIYIISCSFSDYIAINAGRVVLWPVGFTWSGYEYVFRFKDIWVGYRNTLIYTVVGTALNIFMSRLCAYPLSKRDFQGRRTYMNLFFISMFFGAGLIPHYLWNKTLGFINNPLVMIIPGAMGVYNMIILRTAFRSSIPGDLFEAAKIDGANEFRSLFQIAVPLAKPTISVLTLYYAVGHWNAYFSAMIYLRDKNLWPLQLFLRGILTTTEGFKPSDASQTTPNPSGGSSTQIADNTLGAKYALIVVSTVPVLILYAIVQKYFKKGVMVGAVKG